MTLLCKRITVPKSKEIKTRWSNLHRQVWQNLLQKAMAHKEEDDDDDDDDDDKSGSNIGRNRNIFLCQYSDWL
jgi:hypothetical protein